MVDVDLDAAREWVELDGYGKVIGAPFEGTFDELRVRLLGDLGVGTVTARASDVYVRALVAKIRCPLVTLTTPWGTTRWIPRPPARRPRRVRDHLLL